MSTSRPGVEHVSELSSEPDLSKFRCCCLCITHLLAPSPALALGVEPLSSHPSYVGQALKQGILGLGDFELET